LPNLQVRLEIEITQKIKAKWRESRNLIFLKTNVESWDEKKIKNSNYKPIKGLNSLGSTRQIHMSNHEIKITIQGKESEKKSWNLIFKKSMSNYEMRKK
jgi:2,4-dienoyl-CoA reductase-like NADH-dependent reductase (Old Yellow Enzyme family)